VQFERYRAARYSKELSDKVWRGCVRIAEQGYWAGGNPPYGMQRLLLDERREPVGILEPGQHKSIHNQRVTLAGGIAHDFNNILAGIMGYADLVKVRLPASEPAREDLDVIKKAVERAADLTRQMLAYSGKGKFIVEPVNLSRAVEDTKKMLAMSVSKKATVTYNLSPDLPTIEADASQIHQIILNLVINASEALRDNSGAIVISTDTIQLSASDSTAISSGHELREGLCVRLQVSDTGCGMDEQTLAKMFDPFFSTKFTGRGLGLAAVQGIVRGHHGGMRVSSKPGEGTTFEVLFPASNATAPLAVESAPAKPWHGSGTVLVVDDEEIVRNLASRIIEHAGFTVLTANDGEEAIQLYQQHKKDIACVLLDLTMPKLNGEETFRELRQISSGVRVILSSGYSEETATGHFAGLGLAGFIQKPYQLDTMIATLRQAVAGGNTNPDHPI
jgi:signal transduction histidine kinase/CheY-like chemotaxis protein